jgi:hypothetical protein
VVARDTVRLPVVCPRCSQEHLSEFPLALVSAALVNGEALQLRAECHQVSWDASETEREQIRKYCLSVSMDQQRAYSRAKEEQRRERRV